jgi:hypothetical protein
MNVIHHQFDKGDGGHLSDAELLELQQGQLSTARLASVQQHLFVCRECLQAFKDLSDFFTPPQADEAALSEKQIETGWQELKERLPRSAASFQTVPASARVATASRVWLPLAAGLLVTLGLAGFLIWRQQQAEPRLAQASYQLSPSPLQASPIASARPAETTSGQPRVSGQAEPTALPARRQNQAVQAPFSTRELLVTSGEKAATDVAQAQPLFVPAQEKTFSLKLRIYNPRDYHSFRVELLDGERKVVQAVDGKLTKDLAVEAVFARAGLADGKYFLRVTGAHRQNKKVEPLESVIEITGRNN